MIETSRRSFLRGALIVAAASVLPAQAIAFVAPVPVIVGDGIHDDWAGLQAAFDGNPFRCEKDFVRVGAHDAIHVDGGHFYISDTLLVKDRAVVWITRNTFDGGPELEGRPLLELRNINHGRVDTNWLRHESYRATGVAKSRMIRVS